MKHRIYFSDLLYNPIATSIWKSNKGRKKLKQNIVDWTMNFPKILIAWSYLWRNKWQIYYIYCFYSTHGKTNIVMSLANQIARFLLTKVSDMMNFVLNIKAVLLDKSQPDVKPMLCKHNESWKMLQYTWFSFIFSSHIYFFHFKHCEHISWAQNWGD